MRIRDSHAIINNERENIIEMPDHGLDILGEDNRTLFSIFIRGDTIEIGAGDTCKHEGVILDDRFVIIPVSANAVRIRKLKYKSGSKNE